MSTDFNYNNKLIITSGPFKVSSNNVPLDARTRIDDITEIPNIPNPYVGMPIYVKESTSNNNKPQIFIVTSLKKSTLGIDNALIDNYISLEDFLNLTNILNVDSATYEGTKLSIKSKNTELASVDIGNKLVILTQDEYDNLETKEDSVAYIISDKNSYYKEITASNNSLKLTNNDIQTASISSDVTIVVPAVSEYTKIVLYLTLTTAAKVTLPTAKVTSSTDFTTGKVYELTFVTLNGIDWFIDTKVFS